MAACYFCGVQIPAGEKIYRTSLCISCGNPLKICRNCRFYDPGAAHECRENIADPVTDKERANFCDFFLLADRPYGGGNQQDDKKRQARDAFSKLFPE